MNKFILSLGCLLSASLSVAGPFGLEKGISFAEMSKQTKLKPEAMGLYSTPAPPKSHPDFDDYRMLFAPGIGLCRVTAYTPAIATNVYGDEAKHKFNYLQAALTQKYGQPGRDYDMLQPGSVWSERKDWTTALLKTERTLTTYWLPQSSQPDSLQSIGLNVIGLSQSKVMIALTYEFDNIDQCLDWRKKQVNSSL